MTVAPKLRVLVVEDSPTDRELLVAILREDPTIEVVGQAADGEAAVKLAVELRPHLVAMDIYMPKMNGFEATREIMTQAPTPILLVSSSATDREVELSLQAMQVGALAVIEKPSHPDAPAFDRQRARLLSLVKALAQVRVVRRWAANGRPVVTDVTPPPLIRGDAPPTRLIAIAASTGGPAALRQLLGDLPATFPVPVMVVQHIALGFVHGLVEWLQSHCALRIVVAEQGQPLVGGTVAFAPDDRHLGVGKDGRMLVTAEPMIDGFRPSATQLFRTAAATHGNSVVAVMLTGMGSDGVEGLRAVKAAGGTVIAQNESTCVVYGMPREAMKAGVVDAELPLPVIAARLTALVARRRYGNDPRR